MCLAIPAKILGINDDVAKADFGGITRDVDISLVDAKIDDYIIVHAGFAIEVLEEAEALSTLDLFRELLDAAEN